MSLSSRSPERIGPILQNLEKIWKSKPDLRLNQLLSILAQTYGNKSSSDFYYWEDVELENAMARYSKIHNIKS